MDCGANVKEGNDDRDSSLLTYVFNCDECCYINSDRWIIVVRSSEGKVVLLGIVGVEV